MNIYLFELRKKWSSTTIWFLALAFFTWVCFSMYTSFADQSFAAVLDNFPDAFKKAFGLRGDISTVLGYFAFINSFLVLCGAIYASNLGLTAASIEETERTADFLISKPVGRMHILIAKYLAALTHIVIFTLLLGALSLVCIEAYGAGQDYSFRGFILMIIGLLCVELLFFAIGLCISMCLKRMETPLPFSLGIPFGLYIINSFDTMIEDTFIKYLVPFSYFDFVYVAENMSLQTYGILISGIAFSAFSVIGAVLYRRRDISTAT